MRIAIPLANGKVSMHFGHCEKFAFVDIDNGSRMVLRREEIPAPPHQPGFLPVWMAQHNVDLVIAGGMGRRALELFAEHGIKVVTGAPPLEPDQLIQSYLSNTLETGANPCDHDHRHGCGH